MTVHPKRPVPRVISRPGKVPTTALSLTCQSADMNSAGWPTGWEAGLSTSDTEVLGSLPKDRPGLRETTYQTYEPSSVPAGGLLLLPG